MCLFITFIYEINLEIVKFTLLISEHINYLSNANCNLIFSIICAVGVQYTVQ